MRFIDDRGIELGRQLLDGTQPIVNPELDDVDFLGGFLPYGLARLDRVELVPFVRVIQPDVSVAAVMVGHLSMTKLDPSGAPASLSKPVGQGLLRDHVGFHGLVMTDDLDMGAILNEYGLEETIRLALEAGNDWVMICHRVASIDEVHRTLGKLPPERIERALESVARTKTKLQAPHAFSESAFQKIDGSIWDLRVAVLGEEEAARRSPEDGKRSPVETY